MSQINDYQRNNAYQNNNDRPPQKKDYSWGVVIGALILFWPLGLFLLFWKLLVPEQNLKNNAPKENITVKPAPAQSTSSKAKTIAKEVTKTPSYTEKKSKRMKIAGIVLAVVGAILLITTIGGGDTSGLSTFGSILYDLSFGVAGGGLIYGSNQLKKRSQRFALYLAAIGNREAVELDELAMIAEVKETTVEKDMEIMYEQDLLPKGAYVDKGNDMYFVSQEAAAKFFNTKKSNSGYVPVETEEGFSGILRSIRRANDRIPDPDLTAKIDKIENITAQIFKVIEANPEKKKRASTFLNYYLPTTLKLLDSYADFDEAGISGENMDKAKKQVENTIDNIIVGFQHQLDELYADKAMDIQSEAKVMQTMLQRELYTVADDFGLNGGTATQEKKE